jgi:hypothetical protein
MHENPNGIVLVGTSNATHLRDAVRAVGRYDGARLSRMGEFLRDTVGG